MTMTMTDNATIIQEYTDIDTRQLHVDYSYH